MNFKKIATTIELLAITSVVSVGFSAWAIVETTSPTVTATIETENVINNNDYLKINNMIFSDYDSKGFFIDFIYTDPNNTTIDASQNIGRSYIGYLDVEVEIDVERCKEYIPNGNYKFTFELYNDNTSTIVNIIGKAESLQLTASSSDSTISLGEPVTVSLPTFSNGYTLINSISFVNNSSSETMFLYLSYAIKLSSVNFDELYKAISSGELYKSVPFNLKAYLEQGGN